MSNDEPVEIYTKPAWQVWVSVASGAVCIALIVYDLVRFPGRSGAIAHGLLFALALACFLAAHATAKWKVTFYDFRVEWSRAFHRVRRLSEEDIAGYRRTGWGSMWLVPKRGHRAILVPTDALADTVPFLDDIADLDAADREAMRARAADNPRFGATRAEREAFIERLPRRLRWLNGAGWFGGLWVLLWPQPYDLALAFMIAGPALALAIVVWARPLINLDEMRDLPGEIALFGLYFLPPLALAIRLLYDFALESIAGPGLAALAVGTALTLLVAWSDPPLRRRAGSVAGVLLLSVAYAFGVLGHANTLLDKAAPQRFEATAVEKPKKSRYWADLVVTAWGAKRGQNKVKVTSATFAAVKPGDRVCIATHPGALGWRWYVVTVCK